MKIHGVKCKGTFNPYGRFLVTVTEKDGQTRMLPYKNVLAKECWNGVVTHVCLLQLAKNWKTIHQLECF
jgi:hypothetical protein